MIALLVNRLINPDASVTGVNVVTLVPLMLLVVILMLGFMLRSIWATFATVTIILISILTAMAFLSMNFSKVAPLAHLGNIVAVGVLVAWILSISFLPALTVVLPIKVKLLDKQKPTSMTTLGNFVVHRRKPLL